jgi:prolyl oligopeptidase PreP (S9A serine peptidase family)
VVAEVPFVDVVTTMLDPQIPLTVQEWAVWGDPRRPEDYAVMLSYSPYENPPAGHRHAHTGPAGRYVRAGYEAVLYAWVLDRLAAAGGRVADGRAERWTTSS